MVLSELEVPWTPWSATPQHRSPFWSASGLRPLRGKAKDCFTPCAWKQLSRSGGPWFCSSPGILFSENSRMPWKYENWIRIWIHYHPLEHPLEHPLPKWKSMTHSPTMKIHGPFRPWIPPANWSSGCLTSSWGNVLNTTVGHKDATRGDLGREILWYLEMFIDVYRCL